MNDASADRSKIRAKIRSYETKLQHEKKAHGGCMDGAGIRYLIGPSYLLMGDNEGAVASFDWCEAEFQGDCGEPGHHLSWALALLRAGRQEAAVRKLRETMLVNPYILQRLLGLEVVAIDMWHRSNEAEASYLESIPKKYFVLWSEAELEWAAKLYQSEEFRSVLKRHVQIHQELKTARGPRRTELIQEASKLRA